MASITVTWFNESANTTHTYVHEMTDVNMERIIEAGRSIYARMNTETALMEPINKNRSRRLMVREAVREWKDRARQHEITVAQADALANITEIETVEPGSGEE